MSDQPKNFSNSFHILDDQELNKPQKVLKRLGIVAFLTSATAQVVLMILQNFMQINTINPPVYISILIGMFTSGFLIGAFTLTLVAIYYLGRKNGYATFLDSLLHVLRKVFKYLFLPAIIVTIVIILPFLMFGFR